VLKAFSYAGYVAAVLVIIAVVVLFIHRLRVVRSERAAAVNESAQVQR
jgi:nitrate reductase gamma subunit